MPILSVVNSGPGFRNTFSEEASKLGVCSTVEPLTLAASPQLKGGLEAYNTRHKMEPRNPKEPR